MPELLYFAYGSNLLPERLIERVPSAEFRTIARLPFHLLRFQKRGTDGSAKCDVMLSQRESDAVFGVVYAIPSSEKPALDTAEGLGYEVVHGTAVSLLGNLGVFFYRAHPEAIDQSLLPFDWYRALVLAGAKRFGFPASYCHAIEDMETTNDVDSERRCHYLGLLN
jgi:hypothetical protein